MVAYPLDPLPIHEMAMVLLKEASFQLEPFVSIHFIQLVKIELL